MTTKVWLLPIKGAPPQKKQSTLARDLLRVVCVREGLALTEDELSLAGLDLIQCFTRRHQHSLSIAHSNKMLAVAMGPGRIGVDCESKGRARNWQGMANSFFTPAEANTIFCTSPEQRESIFLRHWVLKEAYIKAIHGSIFGDLNRLFFDIKNGPTLSDGSADLPWKYWEIEVAENIIALCSAGGDAAKFVLLGSVSAFADGTNMGKTVPCKIYKGHLHPGKSLLRL